MDQSLNNIEEAIVQKHRKEKKELQAKIQALKKTATKGDKKKKKEVAEEISKLENDLEKRHADEVSVSSSDVSSITNGLDNIAVEEGDTVVEANQVQHLPKVSKAQRRREKKANEMKVRQQRITEQEADNKHGVRHLEIKKIRQILKELNLMLSEIPSDGNCLYNAINDQLKQCTASSDSTGNVGRDHGVVALRRLTSNCLMQNRAEFIPFLSNQVTEELFTDELFSEYCDKVANTTAWAGQVELTALAKALKCRIQVIQAETPIVTVGDSGPLLTVTYHRHMYSLGAHYNSVAPYQPGDQSEEDEE